MLQLSYLIISLRLNVSNSMTPSSAENIVGSSQSKYLGASTGK